MQLIINSVIAEVDRVITKPPSRPIRLMLFDTTKLYGFVLNKIKDSFQSEEIININKFFESDMWINNRNKLAETEEKYGDESFKFQRVLCEVLEKYIINLIKLNKLKKILVIEDSELYINGFDPIHFLAAYMYDHYLILEKEIPIIWMTIGEKEEYSLNEYNYHRTDITKGRTITLTQDSFRSCIFDYKSNY